MMEEALGKIDIVAEDLGTLTPDVTELQALRKPNVLIFGYRLLVCAACLHRTCLTGE